jgi:hypothetical protein
MGEVGYPNYIIQYCHVLWSENNYIFKKCNPNVHNYGKVVMGQV